MRISFTKWVWEVLPSFKLHHEQLPLHNPCEGQALGYFLRHLSWGSALYCERPSSFAAPPRGFSGQPPALLFICLRWRILLITAEPACRANAATTARPGIACTVISFLHPLKQRGAVAACLHGASTGPMQPPLHPWSSAPNLAGVLVLAGHACACCRGAFQPASWLFFTLLPSYVAACWGHLFLSYPCPVYMHRYNGGGWWRFGSPEVFSLSFSCLRRDRGMALSMVNASWVCQWWGIRSSEETRGFKAAELIYEQGQAWMQ